MKTTIENLFFHSVDHYPEKSAIEYGERSITYTKLDQRSNAIANYILQKGLPKDAKIGILLNDRIEIISSILGVLKAGAVFVPFDTSFPVKRLMSMVEVVDFALFFVDNASLPLAEELFEGSTQKPELVNYEHLEAILQDVTLHSRPVVENGPDDPIYIYFTSGSTGKPKGILGRYKGLLHFIQWEIETFAINDTFRTSQFVTPSFDAFLRDTFVPLCVGGTLCIPAEKETMLSADKLAQWIDSAQVNLIHCVPSVFRLLLTGELVKTNFPELKYILMSGERINPKDLRKWYGIFGERVQLVNLYGPSETTMIKTYYLIKEDDQHKASIPIGQPMRGARLLILDDNLKPSPKAMVGEIYIRTPYMTLGYYHAPDLTKEKFIQNPYSTDPNDLLYRTGDLGRALPDGNFELIGRKDYQVKIRGVRVELGDIENQILAHPAVQEVVVIDRESGDGEVYLSAYLVTKEQVSTTEIRAFLAERLPEYMVPAYMVNLEKLPLTPNGKIDRKALPEPDWRMNSGVEYVPPRNTLEEELCAIWSELLDIEKVGINDNFFELGGHSLKATRLEAKIYQQMNVEVPLKVIFTQPTVAELAEYISSTTQKAYVKIPVVEKRDYYPVSFAQKRLFVLNQFMGPNLGYNMPRLHIMIGQLDYARMEDALRKLCERQEGLRTSFSVVDGEPVQIIQSEVDFALEYYRKDNDESYTDGEINEIIKQFIRPFDFSQAPLFRAGILRLAEEKHLFLFDMHHIISDQISIIVLMEELMHLYEGNDLPALHVQYKDYSVWQHEMVKAGEIQKQEQFWLNLLNNDLPVLTLPTDYQRPPVKGTAGDVYNFMIDRELTDELYKLATQHGATLYMVLLAAFNLFLAKYSGQEDIIVGTPLAGRPNPELDNVIGMFVNTLPMRNRPVGTKTFNEFLTEVKESTLAVFDNQEYQIDLLIDQLDLSRDMSRNPLFDVMLVLQNEIEKTDMVTQEIAGLSLQPYPFELHRSKFDFILFAVESTQGIFWQFEYSTELFKAETIERMSTHWQNLLKNICAYPEKLLGQIEMVEGEEKDLLFAFNDLKLDYPRAKTIHQLFEEAVVKSPERIALSFEGQKMTYAELNRRANQLARTLRKNGVGAESVVGIMLKRSPEMVVSLLAILKAGGAYLPIDPDYPTERVLYMLENSGAKLLLTESAFVRNIPFTSLENFAETDADIVLTGIRSHIKEFDRLPMPDRSLIDLSKYKNQIGMASITNCISLQTSRGCPYHCLYCHKVWSKNHVFRTADNIYNEVEYYYQRGVRNFAILDDCFNLNRENSKRFFKLVIQNGLKVKIFFPNGLRGDLLTKDYIDLMVEAGVVNINLSLETASPRLQKSVKKFLDLDKFRDVMEYIATQHPNVILELATMLGFPTETEEEAMMTLNFIQSIKWIHFPYIHVLKVFPNTEMEEFALANGVQKEDILRSVGLAYHELPETLPFPKSFARQYQSRFLNEYFLNPERLKQVLPVQISNIDPAALIQKYNAYLPIEVTKLEDVLDFAGITDFTLPEFSVKSEVPEIFESATQTSRPVPAKGAKKILFLDLSQHFSTHDMLYNVAEQPLGLLYLLTYVKEQFGADIDGRIYKSRNDFDSFQELKAIVDEYQPDLIGIRTLSFYREFFHETVSLLRDWGVTAPIITGGPYATSEYHTILRDKNVDLVIIGEGEYTLAELLHKMLEHDFSIPSVDVLQKIEGIAFNSTYRACLDRAATTAIATIPNDLSRKVLLLDHIAESIEKEAEHNLESVSSATNLAYVMYTSGTTGRPKGIMIEHRQVNNCIFWMQNEFKLDEKALIVQRTNLTFDPSVWEIFWPLYIGGTVKLVSAEQGKDADFLIDLLTDEKEQLTMMYCPASLVTGMVYLLNSRGKDVKLHLPWFLIGAEPIRPDVVKSLYKYLDGTVVNTYGPTECTINNTYCYLKRDQEYTVIPIGRPVANNELFILSNDLQLLPMGMIGEICISGESVARGYINNPEKTAECFVPNPYGLGKLYKTGDLGRWLPDGNIEILGRVDDQVKVRGYRIEPGEIETALLQHPSVHEAVVIVKDPKDKLKNVKTCKLCGVTSAYPGITVNQDGVCNICEEHSHYEKIIMQYFKKPEDLHQLIKETNKEHLGEYDLLLLYAGGRGSAYALYQLVDMGFKVLTATYDNGYFSKQDKARIKQITESLGVDHVWLTHPNTELILCESLQTAHTVCNGCFFTSSSLAASYAKEHGIKVVVAATLSRGQIIENKLYKLMKQGISDVPEIEKELGNLQRNTADLNRKIFDLINIPEVDDGSVYNSIKVVDFYRYFELTNKEMIAYLNARDAYWIKRKNYAIYSTNCPIKQIGDFCHLTTTGYHYYGAATSWEKRLGHITQENLREDLKCRVSAEDFANFSRRVKYEKPRSDDKMDAKYLCAYLVAEEELSFAELREYLLKDLPDYMVPSAFVQLSKLPLTSNGKIDRQALPEPEALIQTSTAYVAPRDEREMGIAEVWAEVLGIAKVGIRDNFIELGGDSIKAIQLASRMNNAGFEVKIKDIFTYQTIEELVPHLSEACKPQIDQGFAEGVMPLTGIQRWFFAEKPAEPYHYNQSVFFALNPLTDITVLEEAFDALIQHHDTLRLNYRSAIDEETYGELFYNEEYLNSNFTIELFDLTNLSEEEQNSQLEFWGGNLKVGFSLENSLLLKAAVFDLGKRGKRLLITVHHLLIDGVSWRILLEDLFTAYQQIKGGDEVHLPPKTNSFKDWASGIVKYSVSEELEREIPYWQEVLKKVYPLPTDYTSEQSIIKTEAVQSGELSREITQQLLTKCNSTYNTEINDLLLVALARTINKWTGKDHVVITLEGHGREDILKELDISRTIGWFTSMYPVNLDLTGHLDLAAQIKGIKEQLRSVSNKGVGYLILKYITQAPELVNLPDASGIIFNYLGQFSEGATSDLFKAASESTGRDSSPDRKRRNFLEFSGLVADGQLRISITYSKTNYTEETVQELVEAYLNQLKAVVDHCTNVEIGSYTPSDFPLAELTQDYLNRLDKRNIEDIYALSPLQEGMLYHYLLDGNASNYFEQSVFTLEGELNLENLEEAWNFVISHNEVLRTAFSWKELERPVQLVYTNQPCKLLVHNLSHLSSEEAEATVSKLREEDKARQFDLENGPNMRITVCVVADKCYQIIMSHHHILFDGWCLGLIFKEIFNTYLMLQEGMNRATIEKNQQWKNRYREYIAWLKNRDLHKAEEFWREYLHGFTEPTALPLDNDSNSIVQSVDMVVLAKSKEFTQKLEAFAKELKVTPNILLQTTWGLLLQRYNNTGDVVFGAVVSGRPAEIPGIEEMIGLFINAIPVRVQGTDERTVAETLKQMQEDSIKRQEFEYASLTWIKDLSELKGVRTQLFDSLFIFENYPIAQSVGEVNPGFRVTGYEAFELTNYDLNIEALNVGENLEVRFAYNVDCFKSETIARLVEHYDNLLQDMLANPAKRVCKLEMLSSAVKEMILHTFNDTTVEYPQERLIHDLIEEQVVLYPDKFAVVYEDQRLTYAEYNYRANLLAQILREKGVGAEEIVGILVEPSVEMTIAVLAVLKAGGAFLPIDPRYPDSRIEYMLTDARCKVLLTQQHYVERSNWPCECLVIDEVISEARSLGSKGENLSHLGSAANLAYVIYTSGSTGLPKGVLVEHRALGNLIHWFNSSHHVTAKDKFSRYAGFSFDASLTEFFPALTSGAELHVIPERLRLDLAALNAYFTENEITIAFLPTVIAEQFIKLENHSLRVLNTGGEKLKGYTKTDYAFIDNYGPTENTIITTSFALDKEHINSPIGKPIANNRVYILDRHLNLQPVGALGELCVAGASLAREYLNNAELTNESFVPDPFYLGERMYHTGDIARWLPDGNIEFIGRNDLQVKIRGFRIDLGEIEAQLQKYELIEEAVVLAHDDANGLKYLTAYIIANDEVNIGKIREHLSKYLPDYMIPAYFIQLERFPLTVNGKIDRQALPQPDGNVMSGTEYVAPVNPLEEVLVQIWSDVLSVEKVGTVDNFFALGGHSLKATTVVARIYKELNVEVALSKIFEYPTIRELAEYLAGKSESTKSSTIKRVADSNYYPVSSAQKRMFVLYHMTSANTQYNVPSAFFLEGQVDLTRLEQTFRTLIKRHESFRTSFAVVNGEYVQRIHDQVEFMIEHQEASESDLPTIIDNFIRPFDLSKAPLLRIGLVKLETRYLLTIDVHHIIADGVSVEILIKEFISLYTGQALPELKIRYRDYAVWENEIQKTQLIKKQEAYWLNKFASDVPVLSLPYDYPRPMIMDIAGENTSFEINNEITLKLRELANAQGATMYMVLLSIFNILLAKYSGQEDIIVGSPSAGRNHPDLESVIGMFVNTLVMRNAPQGDQSFSEFLNAVQVNALQAYENQNYQFETLVEKLNLHRDLSRNPLFDVLFAMQNQVSLQGANSTDQTLQGLQLTPYSFEHNVAKFDLSLNVYETQTGLSLNFEYKTSLFKRETIERMIAHYQNLTKEIVADPTRRLADYRILSAVEEEQLLYSFNRTEKDYPEETLLQMFEAQVARTPDNIALIHGECTWTYREFNATVNRLARILRAKGLGSETIIGIMVQRSFEMAVGLLAILKAGAAYLPIDPASPEERVQYMLKDSNAALLLCQRHLHVNFAGEVFILDAEELHDEVVSQGAGWVEAANLDWIINPTDMAYLIYTSGTTGKPKGVIIEHCNLANTIQWAKEEYSFTADERILGALSYAFDAFGLAFYTSLVSGAQYVIISDDEAKDPLAIKREIILRKINHLSTVPSIYANLLECLSKEEAFCLQKVQLGGEALTTRLVKKSKQICPSVLIFNEYGPTENTIITSIHRGVTPEFVTIGKPIANSQVYILDKYTQLVPNGVIGELCVSGRGLARGYLHQPALTAEKFTLNPYTGQRMYRTGDLARWLPDGSIDFIGRLDTQVKIRGYRIELGEIESLMLTDARITNAVVIDRVDQSGNTYLTAYYVAAQEISANELQEMLAQRLPQYMIPTYYMHLENIPLTINGKVDRSALPEPNYLSRTESSEYVAPQNEVEERLVKIWSEVLGMQQIGINHNFFDLGGHSLKATNMSAKIYKEFHVEVPLRDIFRYSTIKKLAEHIAGLEKCTYTTIEYAEKRDFYPVSSAQRRLLILDQFEDIGVTYNMPSIVQIEGNLELSRLEKALKQLIARHAVLRTFFKYMNGEMVQRIQESTEFAIEHLDWNGAIPFAEEVETTIRQFVRRFDLSQAPLFRVGLAKIEANKYLLFYDLHHVIADGLTMQILIRDLARLYNDDSLPELKMQYTDFAVWQNNLFSSGAMQKQESYWLNQFKDDVPVLELPTDYPRPAVMSFEGDTYKFVVGKDITSGLSKLASSEGVTLYMVLLAAFNVLLARYSGQEDIVIGAPIAGRTNADLAEVAGMFINTLAMRNYPTDSKTYHEFLQEVSENAMSAYENQDYQFELLIEKLKLKHNLSRNPLFDVSFILQNFSEGVIELLDEQLKFTPYSFKNTTAKFDLLLNAAEREEEIAFALEYSTNLFKRETISRMSHHYTNILAEMISTPTKQLGEIDLLSDEERNLILYEFNNTAYEVPTDKVIHQLIEETAERYSDHTAVVYAGQKLTYQMLNERANYLATVLREKGAGPDQIIGIMLEPSLDMLTGILGILKAGSAFLPIDPLYPADRVEYMLSDAQSKILLTQAHLLDRVEYDGEVIVLESIFESEMMNTGTNVIENLTTPENLAYIIYTSGSTGKPKGVMVEHRALVNMCWWFRDYYNLTEKDRGTKYAGFGFDASLLEIFPLLITGAQIHILSYDIRLNLVKLNQYFEDNQITVSFLPTQVAEKFIQLENHSLRCLLTGGDKLKYYTKTNYRLVNNYGPTENTIISTSAEIEEMANNIPIGKPIYNNRVYIVNRNSNLQPVGVPGELCVAGKNLARGYLNHPDLTNDKFVADPFYQDEWMYRTGDLARWLPDGNIEFLGRIDQQVKIRGFRIELGEIEVQLLQDKRIKEASVIDWCDEDDNTVLIAYYVAEETLPVAELKAMLAKTLPEYMVPMYFIQLAVLPLTPNGKVNRKALQKPNAQSLESTYIAPANELEERLVKIWSEVLNKDKIGVTDNFFELGGHSLKATDVISQVYREFEVEISLREIFKTPTVRGLAETIGKAQGSNYAAIPVIEEREFYPVSSAQRRLYILQQFKDNNISYNIPSGRIIKGELDLEHLENIFQTLINRHEAFRTSFDFVAGEPVQRIHKEVEFSLERYSLIEEEIENESVIDENSAKVQQMVQNFVRPFDLNQAPLLRVAVINLGDKHILLMDMHHIIADGTSMAIVLDEIAQLYNGKSLSPLKIQYKDFTVWQNEFFASDRMLEQEEYWLKQFAGEIPILELPTDYPRPAMMTYEGGEVQFATNSELTKRLNQFVNSQGGSMYMLLLTAFNILLAKYANQEDIIIGSPIAGRTHADLAQIVGMFVNTLAMRNAPKGEKTIIEFFAEVKDTALKAYDYQSYQFEMLVDKLKLQRDLNRNPLFDVMLVLQNFNTGKEAISDLQFMPYQCDIPITKFDLLLNVTESTEGIYFTLQYWTKLFRQQTVERMGKHLLKILEAIVDNSDQTIAEIDMLEAEEREQLFIGFNHTATDYPQQITVHQLVEAQVAKTPDAIALSYEDRHLTYRELNAKANQLAHRLRRRGAGPDKIIGLMVERSPEMVIGILAILKAGSAYLPIDPEYPEDRIEFMLKESDAEILLVGNVESTTSHSEKLQKLNYNGIVIDLMNSSNDAIDETYDTNLDNLTMPNNLVYVIYTSGSTGKPKGVMLELQNVCNLLQFEHAATSVNYRSKVLQFASISFDVSFQEIFSTLSAGGELYLVRQELRNNIPQLLQYVAEQEIEILFLPAALVKFIFAENEFAGLLPKCVKDIIVAGEQLVVTQSLRDYLKTNGVRLHNHYGPSETHVVTTLTLNPDEVIPDLPSIGSPISNTHIYILDQYNRLKPLGIPGELCIAGRNVGRGYLNRPDLTADKFVENPFILGERMYHTGDIARWKEDGTIEYMGRKDHQVKIRGFRIEPGEIESKLLDHPEISEAAVIDCTDAKGNKYLAAYIVVEASEGETGVLSSGELREHLLNDLPEYMIPSYFVNLDQLPLTSNGKVNRRALPEVSELSIVTGSDYIAPTNEIEERLAHIWSELLNIEKISISDSFFALGGHSLKATSMIAKVYQQFGIELPLREIFRTPTIQALAAYIASIDQSQNLRTEKDENLVLLRRGTDNAKNLFLVHDGTGEVGGYIELCNHLTTDFHCWGIQADQHETCAAENLEVQVLAKKYVEKIRAIDPEGPYYVAGWSLGGSIAFEMVQQLEEQKAGVAFLALIDSLSPQKEFFKTTKKFTVQSELKWLEDNLPQFVLTNGAAFEGLEEFWAIVEAELSANESGVELLKNGLHPNIIAAIPNVHEASVKELLYYMNRIRSLNRAHAVYMPKHKVHTPVVYFKAKETDKRVMKNWSRYCAGKFTVHEVNGNHFSIFRAENANNFARLFMAEMK